MRSFAFALGLVFLLGGCPAPGTECGEDGECLGGEVCTRDHVCAAPADVRRVWIEWRVRGIDPRAGGCFGVLELSVSFVDTSGTYDDHTYVPVPCPQGMFVVDRLSTRYDLVRVVAFDGNHTEIAGAEAALTGSEALLSLDLR